MDFSEFRKLEFERRDLRLKNSRPMKLAKTGLKKDRLHIVYVMTWTGICGGSKIILQHCNELVGLGHRATIVCHFSKPGWFPLDERVGFIQAPMGEVLCEYIPKCDVIVATYWKEIYECVEQGVAPVVYFEQGDNHLFAPEMMDARTMAHIRKQIELAPFIYTVSNYAKEELQARFNALAAVIPNAVDKTVFYPDVNGKTVNGKTVITAIGSANISFKRVTNILISVQVLSKMGYDIEFIWISPDAPNNISAVQPLVNPAQGVIGDCLRRSDIFVCASLYESFCLPVLEAMTCKTAVVTTDCGGVRDFVKDNENSLLIKKNDIADMVEKLAMLINDAKLRERLAENALKTAEGFDWSITAARLVEYYREIASYNVLTE